MKFEGRSEEETESKAWNLANHVQAQRERQSYITLARGRMGTPGCVKKRAGKRDFVVDSGASMHMVSKRDLNSKLETMSTLRSPTTVMTAKARCKRETRQRSVYVKELNVIVTVVFLEETPAVLS